MDRAKMIWWSATPFCNANFLNIVYPKKIPLIFGISSKKLFTSLKVWDIRGIYLCLVGLWAGQAERGSPQGIARPPSCWACYWPADSGLQTRPISVSLYSRNSRIFKWRSHCHSYENWSKIDQISSSVFFLTFANFRVKNVLWSHMVMASI